MGKKRKLDLSSLNIQGVLSDIGVEFKTSGKNVSAGWINIRCVFCKDHGHHLGINLKSKMFSCWVCRESGSIFGLIKSILNTDNKETFKVIKKHLQDVRFSYQDVEEEAEQEKSLEVQLPTHLYDNPLPIHKRYLEERGFSHRSLETVFRIKYSGQISKYKTADKMSVDFKFRIIIPVFINGKLVNFTGRDVTGCSEERYKNCPTADTLLTTKDALYGYDSIVDGVAALVEGPTDVWRLGPGALGLFGLKYTENQLKLLYEKQLRKAVLFMDNEPVAQKIAKKLAREIGTFIPEVSILEPDSDMTDPGELTKEQVREFWKLVHGG